MGNTFIAILRRLRSKCEMSHTEKTASELDSLRLTNDFFEKIIMRRDIPASFTDENGIPHVNRTDCRWTS